MREEELFRRIAGLRRERTFQTNLFSLPFQINEIAARRDSILVAENRWLLILERSTSFYRLHYFVAGMEELHRVGAAVVKSHSELPVVADVVNLPQAARRAADTLTAAGFSPIETLTYMTSRPEDTAAFLDFPQVERAVAQDSDTIERLLHQTFQIYISRLPTKETIEVLAKKGLILVERGSQGIMGLAIFKELSTRQLLLDQLLVDHGCRGGGVGKRLLQTGVKRLGSGKTVLLWAAEEALSFYQKLGFQSENRVDHILLYRGEEHDGKNLHHLAAAASGI